MNPGAAIPAQLAAGARIAARVMIIVAHPDDETIGLGAQLCRFEDALLVHLTDGAPRDGHDARNYGFASVADYAAARRAELTAALFAGGAERVRILDLAISDKEAWRDLAGLTARIGDLLRTERPLPSSRMPMRAAIPITTPPPSPRTPLAVWWTPRRRSSNCRSITAATETL